MGVLQKKDFLYRSIPLVITALFFFMIAPIPQLAFMRNVEPVMLFAGTILFVDGIILIVEMFRNLPDAGNHMGAKTGAYLFGIMGAIVLIFAVAIITDQYNPFDNMGENAIILTLTAILGITAIVQYASIHPMLFHGKKNLAKVIRG